MALQPTQHPSNAGTLTLNTVATGDIANLGSGTNTVLIIKNGDSASHTLTIPVSGNTDYGKALPAQTVTVAAGAVAVVPLHRDFDNGAGTNTATLNFDATTSVTVAVLQVP